MTRQIIVFFSYSTLVRTLVQCVCKMRKEKKLYDDKFYTTLDRLLIKFYLSYLENMFQNSKNDKIAFLSSEIIINTFKFLAIISDVFNGFWNIKRLYARTYLYTM